MYFDQLNLHFLEWLHSLGLRTFRIHNLQLYYTIRQVNTPKANAKSCNNFFIVYYNLLLLNNKS